MSDDHEPDAAAEAFEGVRGELALLRRAVERLAAERAEVPEIPDYSETLGRMAKALNGTMQNVAVLAKAAEDNVAPRYVADRIVAAGAHARDEDRRMIASAVEKMESATRSLHGIGGVARRADEQRRMPHPQRSPHRGRFLDGGSDDDEDDGKEPEAAVVALPCRHSNDRHGHRRQVHADGADH